MDVFTMVIVACVAGEKNCEHRRISEPSFTSLEACESRIDESASAMTRMFAQRPGMKGRQVTYDIACFDRAQLRAKLGVESADI